MKVLKINWQRVTRSALYAEGYGDRLLDDIRRETGKDTWTLQELKALWSSANTRTDTWGAFCKEAIESFRK